MLLCLTLMTKQRLSEARTAIRGVAATTKDVNMTYTFIWTTYGPKGEVTDVSEREFSGFPSLNDAKLVWESLHKPSCRYSLEVTATKGFTQ